MHTRADVLTRVVLSIHATLHVLRLIYTSYLHKPSRPFMFECLSSLLQTSASVVTPVVRTALYAAGGFRVQASVIALGAAPAPEAPGQPGVTGRGHLDSPGGSKQPLSKLRLHGPSRLDSRPWRPPQDLPRTGPTGIVPQGGTREAGKNYLDSLWTAWEALGRQERTNWTACEAPGTQERTIWTACEVGRHKGCTRGVKGNPDQGGRKGPFGQPGRHQGGTREAG